MALRVVNKSVKNLTVDVTYLDQVNRVFGKDSPVGRYHGDNYLANVAYQLPLGKLTGFAYLTDFDEAPRDSAQTLGMRFAGEKPVQKVKVAWLRLVGAADRNARTIRSTSRRTSTPPSSTGTFRQYSLGVGYEVMEGNGVRGFSTPLATLHKFDGWADKFLTTPPNGLERRYVTARLHDEGAGRSGDGVRHRRVSPVRLQPVEHRLRLGGGPAAAGQVSAVQFPAEVCRLQRRLRSRPTPDKYWVRARLRLVSAAPAVGKPRWEKRRCGGTLAAIFFEPHRSVHEPAVA